MIGKHRVIIEADKVNYTFEVKRNITIIQGDSASGKTTLVDLIRTYGRYKEESGISMVSDVPCVAFSGDGDNWKPVLDAYKDSIVFFDEDYSFIFSEDFAAKVKGSSNYFVLITRQPLKNLPYSINEIYGIRRTGKYHFPEKIYHEFYPIYPAQRQREDANTLLLVEDEKAGYQFYKRSCNKTECISAKGNGNVKSILNDMPYDRPVVVIADGAAFGAYIAGVIAVARTMKEVSLYFPESFEWIVLKSGILNIKDLKDILEHPEDYIDSAKYFSWERFFTELIESETADDKIKKYDKEKINTFYLEGKNSQLIKGVLPEEIRDLLQ